MVWEPAPRRHTGFVGPTLKDVTGCQQCIEPFDGVRPVSAPEDEVVAPVDDRQRIDLNHSHAFNALQEGPCVVRRAHTVEPLGAYHQSANLGHRELHRQVWSPSNPHGYRDASVRKQ